ncbi:DUF732 domain-containing protein [Mycolicibacterium sp. XJ775]
MDEGSADPTQVRGELTELAGVAEADTMSSYAWSEDDASLDVEPQSDRPFWVTTAAVAVSAGLVTAAAVLGYRYATDEAPRPAALSAPVTTTSAPPTPAAAQPVPPPPPVTVTTVVVQSTVPAPQALPEPVGPIVLPTAMPNPLPPLSDRDRLFVSRLQGQGWWVAYPQVMAYRAWETCAMLHNGEPLSQVQMKLMQLQDVDVQNGMVARQFIDTAAATYANCP